MKHDIESACPKNVQKQLRKNNIHKGDVSGALLLEANSG